MGRRHPKNRTPAKAPEGDRPIFSARKKEWLFFAALLAAIVLVYQPAWNGGFVWDDDMHVTRPELRSWQGLYHIWFNVAATVQYYPLLHSAFWIEHKLWGDAPLGYHLVNILLHAAAAILAAIILRRLAIPGAYLAAAIFAMHPVHVESVAWITEQKNTLSAVFYLVAALVYLRFDRTRKTSSYCCALGLFALAVLSKTVTATLPGALLVIFWWQRGRLSWKKDVLPLVPFFLLGAGGGLITAWWELQINHCVGPEFAFSAVERLLIAGRTVWFCLGKLLWPTHLTFIYPRWHIDSSLWWQYLFPLGAAGLLVAFWAIRRRTRSPLAALLYFGGTLFPVLGFFNLYTFRYSLVADHYQYLASLGIIALAAAGGALLLERLGLWRRPGGYALCLGLLAVLAGLTFNQSRIYRDSETLYRATIAENPDCWMAHNNLGAILLDRGRGDDAIAEFQRTLQIKPDHAEAHYNLGLLMAGRGQVDEAVAHYLKALEIRPDYAEAHGNLGNVLFGRGQADEAIAHYRQALKIMPNHAETRNNLGNVLLDRGQVDEAIAQYRQALQIKPDYAEAHSNLGNALLRRKQVDEAIAQYRQAVEIKPDYAEAHGNLGNVLLSRGQLDEAIAQYRQALQIKPDFAGVRRNLDAALSQRQSIFNALAERRELLRSRPNDVTLLNDTAWLLATNPNASFRNGTEAVDLARRAAQISGGREPAVLGTLAAAYAEAGRFPEAVQTARKALELAAQRNNRALAESIEAKILLYEAGTPFRETQGASAQRFTAPEKSDNN